MLMLAEDNERRKVVILGDTHVGKTCITDAMRGLPFQPDIPATIGVDYCSIDFETNGEMMTFDIYDTAGQEKFHSVTLNSLRDARIGLVVYDVTDRKSFENVEMWSEKINEGSGPNCVQILLANKIDMTDKRKVKKIEGEDKAKQLGMKAFFEVSAKNRYNFYPILQLMAEDDKKTEPRKVELVISSTTEIEQKKKGCCGK